MQVAQSDEIYRRRLGTLRSVDDLLAAVLGKLEATGALESTYVFLTGDHGFHLGQLAMGFDKRQLYETDIRVPYLVRGPGVPAGAQRREIITHVDLAPTIVELATGSAPKDWDGRSYAKLLKGTEPEAWRPDALIQYFGESGLPEKCGSGIEEYVDVDGRSTAWYVGQYIPALCDSWNNTYHCVRTASHDQDDIYCEFTCYDEGHNEIPCPADSPEAQGEYYDLTADPEQVTNAIAALEPTKRAALARRVAELRRCRGQAECQGPQEPQLFA